MTKYSVYEVDKYGNEFFVTYRKSLEWAENFIHSQPDPIDDGKYIIKIEEDNSESL